MKIQESFFIDFKKFEKYLDMAHDWHIRSLKLKGIDREIADLYCKKYKKTANDYLLKAKEAIDGK